MTGADFILAINLLTAGLLAATFVALGFFVEHRAAARWFAASYATGAANFLFELLLPSTNGAWTVGFGAFAAFLAALAFFNAGIARLYGLTVPWRALAVLFLAGCAVRIAIDGMPRELLSRQLIYQAPYVAMQAVGVRLLWRARRRPLDEILLGVTCLACLHYLLKPLISAVTGGVGASPGSYSDTLYAMISQSSGTVLGLGMALLLVVILVRDVLEGLATRADTDSLSGLFNRQAFERRRDALLVRRAAGGPPLSLVLCDLDDFKLVNDTYGHAVGDRVIAEFGRLLRQSTRDWQTAGRVGGEEFAVLLPGANLAAARLFAEHLRTAFAVMPIDGLATGHHCTASFGVAEATAGEAGKEMQARADAALYAAKRGGRDCVRVAAPSEVAGEPSGAGKSARWSGAASRERRG